MIRNFAYFVMFKRKIICKYSRQKNEQTYADGNV